MPCASSLTRLEGCGVCTPGSLPSASCISLIFATLPSSMTDMRTCSSWVSGIVGGIPIDFGLASHDVRELDRIAEMHVRFAQRHIEEDFRVDVVEPRKTIAIENDRLVFADYNQPRGSGRKKGRSRYAQLFQSRGSMLSTSFSNRPASPEMILFIFCSSMIISPSLSKRTGLPIAMTSRALGSGILPSLRSFFLVSQIGFCMSLPF